MRYRHRQPHPKLMAVEFWFRGMGGSMPVIWNPAGMYRRIDYESEADLESAIIQVQHQLFGRNRFYLDIKRKIGAKGAVQNVPDGYLLDFSSAKPLLYVVENELQAHDPLRH